MKLYLSFMPLLWGRPSYVDSRLRETTTNGNFEKSVLCSKEESQSPWAHCERDWTLLQECGALTLAKFLTYSWTLP